jgi:hypothetical protein
MRNDLKIILVIFLVTGEFVIIRGFQNNLGIMDIITIYIIFISFLIGFALITASITNVIGWISNILFKK